MKVGRGCGATAVNSCRRDAWIGLSPPSLRLVAPQARLSLTVVGAYDLGRDNDGMDRAKSPAFPVWPM